MDSEPVRPARSDLERKISLPYIGEGRRWVKQQRRVACSSAAVRQSGGKCVRKSSVDPEWATAVLLYDRAAKRKRECETRACLRSRGEYLFVCLWDSL